MGHWEVGGGVRGVVFGVLFFCMIGLWGMVLCSAWKWWVGRWGEEMKLTLNEH